MVAAATASVLRGARGFAIKLGLAASAATIDAVADSAVLLQAATASGVQARLIDWRGPGWAWPDAVLLHTPWDYTEHLGEFAAWLAAQAARTTVVNPWSTTKGNLHKSYLLDLPAAGIAVPVTRLLRAGDVVDDSDLRSTFGAGPMVAKPAVGAGGRRMSRLNDVAGVRTCDLVSPGGAVLEDLLLQEFLPAVQTAGEHALVMIAGQVSHLVHKVAAAGEFRVQASHGGTEHIVDPDDATAEVERTVLPLVADLAYARVDYIVDPETGAPADGTRAHRARSLPTPPPASSTPARRARLQTMGDESVSDPRPEQHQAVSATDTKPRHPVGAATRTPGNRGFGWSAARSPPCRMTAANCRRTGAGHRGRGRPRRFPAALRAPRQRRGRRPPRRRTGRRPCREPGHAAPQARYRTPRPACRR